ncbi:type II restriction m6 adenine DNA methyltransferase, Alw26I/Eco31I/Esp3I family [Tritonibacter multivorans]|uniref:site-specific DNA-methyltransferase (adenine-specific) n=1 Tax=Tritonibacter multivorans TaxID=928856 RepID=A0A0P1G9E3_9RHOB|nr:BREX-1 system adenine-specific DNA-methyltransferase PglX [Tritonibacter multivorans]MDA7421708.1 BREX-1 system adenine-specific DNA-methyltransferase PglX [Tritonibacter multivorans]CUH78059.1 type II restriction m6 adenine DNA methyltransferase, Alw26I/Eco31I/Esp3I family [Tritonibacter multivorans]SFD03330.1 Methyltransferase domain-containing protein [Tritonibacter multivorans]
MDTTKLRKFAQFARSTLIDQVAARMDAVLSEGSRAQREHPKAFKKLEALVAKHGPEHVVEKVAYVWFNRFTALRYMDVNGLSPVRIVSPSVGQFQPEILSDAKSGSINEQIVSEITRQKVLSLLDGRIDSPDPQGEAYRLLVVAACNYWHEALPFMFERIDDYTELLMPSDLQSNASILAYLREAMTPDVCEDVEIIGWLYQFYISEKKDQVFAGLKKNQKITAENIPAATQLFTPHWIVRYLVENSLGRLWLLNNPQSRLAERMDYYIAPEEPETDFLKITKPEEIRICDPAAGSGHMLTYAFDLLYAIYEEEGYDATEIPALILTNNLTGVEIDDRAGALAAFALAMKAAAKLGRRRFLRMEAKPDICVLQNVAFTEAEMQDVAAVVGKDLFTDELRETLGQFEQAKNFGSLIVPKLRDPAETLRVVEARDFAGDLLLKEVQDRVIAVLRMAEALSPKYHVVVANPPYMGGKGMNPKLGAFAKESYPDSKSDLLTMFMERSASLARASGMIAMINLPSWMFLSSYEKLRELLLSSQHIYSLLQLGRGLFGADFGTVAFVLRNSKSAEGETGIYRRLFEKHVDVRKSETIQNLFLEKDYGRFVCDSSVFEQIPGHPIAFWISSRALENFKQPKFQDQYTAKKGMAIGDNARFLRQWFEVSENKQNRDAHDASETMQHKWYPCLHGGSFRKWGSNKESVVNWLENGSEAKNAISQKTGDHWSRYIISTDFFFRPGLNWTAISSSSFSARYHPHGFAFSSASMAAFDEDENTTHGLALINSRVGAYYFNLLSPTLNYGISEVKKTPLVEGSASTKIESNTRELVHLSESDWDAYETSWDFTTLPLLQNDHREGTLEATYTTLRTHWQGMTDEMQRLEEENNRIFIDAYGLQDELTPEVPLNEITLTCNPAYRYGIKNDTAANESRLRADTMAEFLSYAVGCMFGRYSLDARGLILANQGETLADYLARVPAPSFMPDEDNVIPVLDENWFPDDITERFRLFLRVTFGEAHFRENLRYIEDALGKEIRKYFTKDFYADHVKRYKKRPIYWMFSSPKGTFNALIYMHRYQSDTVSVLLNDYLREFITKLEGERVNEQKRSDDPTETKANQTKALKKVSVLSKQINELNEWEREVIFPLAQRKIEIDLDDGVKANYPLFGSALKKIAGLS